MNVSSALIPLTLFPQSSVAPEIPDEKPLARTLRLAGLTPLDADEVNRYRAAMVRQYSSWFAPAARWYRGVGGWVSALIVAGMVLSVFAVAASVPVAFFVSHTAALWSWSVSLPSFWLLLGLNVIAKRFEGVQFRDAAWVRHPACLDGLPAPVRAVIDRLPERLTGTALTVEKLEVTSRVVDPILWVAEGGERYALAVWFEDHVIATA